jgi:inhibitor of KinA
MMPWRDVREAGDGAVLLDFGDAASEEVNARVHQMFEQLARARISGVVGLIPAFSSILVEFDPLRIDSKTLIHRMAAIGDEPVKAPPSRLIQIPVLYDDDAGPDLEWTAHQLGITRDELISRHTSQPYRIFCLGFAPGFPLAGLLPESLRIARRASPRTEVPPGSVAIAGAQTGIYPQASPGGWHLIGRTPLTLFRWDAEPPCFYAPGDRLQFYPISPAEFQNWRHTNRDDPGEE